MDNSGCNQLSGGIVLTSGVRTVGLDSPEGGRPVSHCDDGTHPAYHREVPRSEASDLNMGNGDQCRTTPSDHSQHVAATKANVPNTVRWSGEPGNGTGMDRYVSSNETTLADHGRDEVPKPEADVPKTGGWSVGLGNGVGMNGGVTGLQTDRNQTEVNLGGWNVGTQNGAGVNGTISQSGTIPADHGRIGTSRIVTDAGGRNCVPGNGVSVNGAGLSSFFLHRNITSPPNIAIVQPSVHTAMPQSTTVDHHIDNPGTQPSFVGPANPLDSLPVQDQNVCSCTDKTYQAGTLLKNHQQVVSVVFSSSAEPAPPSTMTVLPPENGADSLVPPKRPETYRISSSSGEAATSSATIFAIPPSYVTDSRMAEFQNPRNLMSMPEFPNGKSLALDFPTSMCIADDITYEEIPVDDTSSVSSITSDVASATRSIARGR